MKRRQKVETTNYQQLGKAMESVFARDYVSRSKLYWLSFSRGLFTGLGITLGSTVGIALLLWILSFFNDVPLLSNFIDKVDSTIQQ